MKVEPSSVCLYVNYNIKTNCKENNRVIDLNYGIGTIEVWTIGLLPTLVFISTSTVIDVLDEQLKKLLHWYTALRVTSILEYELYQELTLYHNRINNKTRTPIIKILY